MAGAGEGQFFAYPSLFMFHCSFSSRMFRYEREGEIYRLFGDERDRRDTPHELFHYPVLFVPEGVLNSTVLMFLWAFYRSCLHNTHLNVALSLF